MRRVFLAFLTALAWGVETAGAEAATPDLAIVKAEFIVDNPPFPTSHSSTIVETKETLLAAWFGGSRERSPDISIWLSRYDGHSWSAPEQVVTGLNERWQVRYPCWNPVLFRPKDGPLLLFYKVGPSPETWWGMVMTSQDNGRTWTKPKRLRSNIYGPIRNKPVELESGWLLCGSSTENAGWRVHIERTKNPLKGWDRTPPLNSAMEFGAIQPTILAHRSGKIQVLCRTKQGKIAECWSDHDGQTWSSMKATDLPNPNSAIDALMLQDGRALLVYNHSPTDRGLLNVALSADGKKWQAALVLESQPGDEYSYPAVIQSRDGLVHVTYTWKRQRIKHVALDPAKLKPRDIVEGQWPD